MISLLQPPRRPRCARSLLAVAALLLGSLAGRAAEATPTTFFACGQNSSGQLGSASALLSLHPTLPWEDVAAFAAGSEHTLIVRSDGSLWACGRNDEGQLGDGSRTTRTAPVQILAAGVRAVAAGARHSLIIMADGALWACGRNGEGQLGDGSLIDRLQPVLIMADGVAAAAAGQAHTLVVKADGSLWTWGSNAYGQLGDGTLAVGRAVPAQILPAGVAAVAAGKDYSLVVGSDGALAACGSNLTFQLGLPGAPPAVDTLTTVLPAGVALAAAGQAHSLIVKTDGSLWACGANDQGQLGDGSGETQSEFVPVTIRVRDTAVSVAQVAAGTAHSLILGHDGSLWACGDNAAGQLGDGTVAARATPVAIAAAGTLDVSAIAAGAQFSLAAVTGQCTVTFRAGAHGAVSGATEQTIVRGGSTTPVSTIPEYGYTFWRWSDGGTTTPRVATGIMRNTTLTASFRTAGPVAPTGAFLAMIDAAAVANGRGFWDLSGTYDTSVAGLPLTLTVVHDPKGKLTGTASLALTAETAIPLTLKGSVKGVGKDIAVTLALKSVSSLKTAKVALALALVLDPATAKLTGPVTGSLKTATGTTPVSASLTLDAPAAMDGTWSVLFEFATTGTVVTGTARLTLAHGVDYLYAVKGSVDGTAVVLKLAAERSDPSAKALAITAVVTPQQDGWARLVSLAGKGYGQSLTW